MCQARHAADSEAELTTASPSQLYTVSEAACCSQQSAPAPSPSQVASLASLASANPASVAAAVAALGLVTYGLTRDLSKGSRAYNNNVGQEYDAWTEEGVLEYYWGEHIHLGVYTEEERKAGAFKKDFKQAKYDFIDDMLKFSGADQPKSILDVGCGFGGTSRHLAKKFRDAQVRGTHLLPAVARRQSPAHAPRAQDTAQLPRTVGAPRTGT